MFGNFGEQFQAVGAQAQPQEFHEQFVNLLSAGARAYLGAEVSNTEQGPASCRGGPAQLAAATTRLGSRDTTSRGAVSQTSIHNRGE